ncbi:MAG: DUF488 family protein [Deltaproteobacteria bacterium]|nr:DUF488 family protein [Deltaproteobacteria bacterium]
MFRPLVKTKSIYDPPTKDDGLRVLVTRYWPRGVKKEEQDFWLRGMGPIPELIKAWKSGGDHVGRVREELPIRLRENAT